MDRCFESPPPRQGATHLTRLCRDRVSADVGVGCHSPPAARHDRPQGKERIILDSVYIYIYSIYVYIYILYIYIYIYYIRIYIYKT